MSDTRELYLMDMNNLYYATKRSGKSVQYSALLDAIGTFDVGKMYCHARFNPESSLGDRLHELGFELYCKVPLRQGNSSIYFCDWTAEIVQDAVYEAVKGSSDLRITVGSNDKRLAGVLRFLTRFCKVRVVACGIPKMFKEIEGVECVEIPDSACTQREEQPQKK